MRQLSKRHIQEIQHRVLDWYGANRRDLPWRRTRDPYAILVSEIMLQQTQVSRVIAKYEEFLVQFPTVQTLAAASPAAVIRAWKGLGYNRRALNLQRAAKAIVERAEISPDPSLGKRGTKRTSPFAKGDREGFDASGIWPTTAEELMNFPGLGRYTAGAVATFAFGVVTPAVDTNVRRFIDHWFPVPNRRNSSPTCKSHSRSGIYRLDREYYELAAQLIPPDRPTEWLHAVMDYSSLVLRRRQEPTPLGCKPRTPQGCRRGSRKGRSEPFVGSNRYLRGRTIDLLRDQPAAVADLFLRVAQPIEVGEDRYGSVLAALVHEGFIEHVRGRYQLKDDIHHSSLIIDHETQPGMMDG